MESPTTSHEIVNGSDPNNLVGCVFDRYECVYVVASNVGSDSYIVAEFVPAESWHVDVFEVSKNMLFSFFRILEA